MMGFLGNTEITDVQTICFCEVCFEITLPGNSDIEVNTCKNAPKVRHSVFSICSVSGATLSFSNVAMLRLGKTIGS